MHEGPAPVDVSAYAGRLDEVAGQLGVRIEARHDGPVVVAPVQSPDDGHFRYYDVHSMHARESPFGYEPFTGHITMVRVTLPEDVPLIMKTRAGSVEPKDHFLATVKEANQQFQATLGHPLHRVDLITPPRLCGVRFGAVAVYLGYGEMEHVPSCYVLETGTATGQSRVLFLGRTIDTMIVRYSGYKPTPFSNPGNTYTGQLKLDGDIPRGCPESCRN
jgi:hypothetical protein